MTSENGVIRKEKIAENITENELARLTDTSRLEKSEKNEKRNENRKSETSRKRKWREEDEMAEKTNKQAKIDYDNKECTGGSIRKSRPFRQSSSDTRHPMGVVSSDKARRTTNGSSPFRQSLSDLVRQSSSDNQWE